MEMLVSLSLSLNTLNGTIPTELGRLTNVQELYFIYNHLTGTVPSQLGNLSKLERLSLFRMQLSGSMPSEICALFDHGALMQLENSCEMVACDCCTRCINPTTVGTGGNN
jgi:Leucine-rich repeat (LRR) protein